MTVVRRPHLPLLPPLPPPPPRPQKRWRLNANCRRRGELFWGASMCQRRKGGHLSQVAWEAERRDGGQVGDPPTKVIRQRSSMHAARLVTCGGDVWSKEVNGATDGVEPPPYPLLRRTFLSPPFLPSASPPCLTASLSPPPPLPYTPVPSRTLL